MTKEQEESIEYLNESILIYKNTIPKISQAIETVLNMLKEKDKEIEEYKRMIAAGIINAAKDELVQEKNIEIEKKDKQKNILKGKVKMEIEDLKTHCVEQMRKLPKGSKMYEEHLLTLSIIDTNKKYFDEIDKLSKVIDLITEFLGERDLGYYKKEDGGEILGMMRIYNKDDWKQYFKEIAERKSKE